MKKHSWILWFGGFIAGRYIPHELNITNYLIILGSCLLAFSIVLALNLLDKEKS